MYTPHRRLSLTWALPLLLASVGCTADNPLLGSDPLAGGPHALGLISLGELHAPGGGTATPQVSAVFVPDATLLKKCTTTIAGCEVVKAPTCGTDPGSGCKTADGEVCQYDDSCQPRCVKACVAMCAAGEECYFAAPDSPSCRQRESFDAGALAFAGTTTSLTLFPPYSFMSHGSGALFLEKASLTVSASGATAAGFASFQQGFTATTFVRTEPPLNKLTRGQVFGTGTVPVKWVPGEDSIEISASSIGGSATCQAMDAAGSFDLPREVVQAVLGDRTDVTQQLTIGVTRKKADLVKGLATKGTLLTKTVQSEGWLQLSTASSESAQLQGCGVGTALCDSSSDMCIDLRGDEKNCGKCGNACEMLDSCHNGRCCGPIACDKCHTTAEAGPCMAALSACRADMGPMGCATLADCLAACTSGSCRGQCYGMSTQTARSLLDKLNSCLDNACSSVCRC